MALEILAKQLAGKLGFSFLPYVNVREFGPLRWAFFLIPEDYERPMFVHLDDSGFDHPVLDNFVKRAPILSCSWTDVHETDSIRIVCMLACFFIEEMAMRLAWRGVWQGILDSNQWSRNQNPLP